MVKADIKGYIDIVDFFRNEQATDKKSAIRTRIAERKNNKISSHMLRALYKEDILEKWQKGEGKPYPVKEKTGERIDGSKAEEIIDSWFPDLIKELKSHSKKKEAVKEELQEDEFSEIDEKSESNDLTEKVSAASKLIEAVKESSANIETDYTEVGFRRPSNRWYLNENYV